MFNSLRQHHSNVRAPGYGAQAGALRALTIFFNNLIYKVTEQPAPQQLDEAMDAEQQRGWDLWCRRTVENMLAEAPVFSEAQEQTMGIIIFELRKEWRKFTRVHVAKELAKLRAELNAKVAPWPPGLAKHRFFRA